MCLKDFCLIPELELETEAEFEDGDFLVASGSDEVEGLVRFGRVFGHHQVFEEFEDAFFETGADRVAEAFFEVSAYRHD